MLADEEVAAIWSSRDSVVLKVMTNLLSQRLLPILSKRCFHLKGHGGLKGAIREVQAVLPEYRFFCKTDVHSFYDNIDHRRLLFQLQEHVRDRRLIGYVWQFLNRSIEWGGLFKDVRRGVARSCSLSPLMGALYLLELDREMERHDVRYIRFMDDLLILSRTRWKLKRAVKAMNSILGRYGMEKHPRKTDMGRVERGFDFLGYRLSPGDIAVADKTLVNFLGRAFRLQEQGRTRRKAEPSASRSLGRYVRGWLWWCRRGLRVKPDKGTILVRAMKLLQSLCEQAGGSWLRDFVVSSLSVFA